MTKDIQGLLLGGGALRPDFFKFRLFPMSLLKLVEQFQIAAASG
jgi:hypothetical protein